jgi:hypothetical protein
MWGRKRKEKIIWWKTFRQLYGNGMENGEVMGESEAELSERERGGRKLGLRSAVVFPRLPSPGVLVVTGSSARATRR